MNTKITTVRSDEKMAGKAGLRVIFGLAADVGDAACLVRRWLPLLFATSLAFYAGQGSDGGGG